MNLTPCRRLGLARVSRSGSKPPTSTPRSCDFKTTESTPLKGNNQLMLTSSNESTPVRSRASPSQCDLKNHSRPSLGRQILSSGCIKRKFVDLEDKTLVGGISLDNVRNSVTCQDTPHNCSTESISDSNKSSKNEQLLKRSKSECKIQHCDAGLDEQAKTAKQVKLNLIITPPTEKDLNSLRSKVALKEKRLKELQLADVYRKKHDPEQLSKMIQQWLQGCQDALQELLQSLTTQGHSMSMTELLSQLGIPPDLVHYNLDDEDFE